MLSMISALEHQLTILEHDQKNFEKKTVHFDQQEIREY